MDQYRGVTGKGQGGNCPLDFGRIGGAAGQQQRPLLLLAPPVLGSLLRPCIRLVITNLGTRLANVVADHNDLLRQ